MNLLPTKSLYRAETVSRQQGMTLVELMVSVAVGIILMAGMTSLFINQTKVQSSLDKSSLMIENGRYAMQLLADELQVAGYYGPLDAVPSAPGTFPNPCDTGTLAADIALHVQGINNASATNTAGWGCLSDIKLGTDILVIRRTETKPAVVPPGGNATFYFQASRCGKDSSKYAIGKEPADFPLHARNCTDFAHVQRMLVRIYYVTNNNIIAPTPDGIPTLKRVELGLDGNFGAPDPLAEGIEEMQLLWGLDYEKTDPVTGFAVPGEDGVADIFDNCQDCPVAGPSFVANTVAMRVHLLARGTEKFSDYTDTKTYRLGDVARGPLNDSYKRHVFAQTVNLVNKRP